MSINPDDFRLKSRRRVRLSRWPTAIDPLYESTEEYEATLADHHIRLGHRQALLAADRRYGVLMIIQAMDAAGKDSVIQHVMTGL